MQRADVMDTETARRTVLRALDRNPHDSFTSVRLSQTLGMPLAQVLHALEELTRAGLVLTIDGEYVSALQLD
jgi:predicted transcriptional regulator